MHTLGDLTAAQAAHRGIAPTGPKVKSIVRACCAYFLVPENEFFSMRRTPDLVYARQICMYLAKTLTTRSFPEIGRCMHRDHSTVLHGSRKIAMQVRTNSSVAYDIAHLELMLLNT